MKEFKMDFYDKTHLKAYDLNATMRYQLAVLDNLDLFTRIHSENVANLTCRICEELNFNKEFTVFCTVCAFLHDIGKMFIPPEILQKPTKLTDEEYEVMKTHTTIGYNMCMQDKQLRRYANGAKYHHEALNGTGYPEGLFRKDIPVEGQIIRVADEFDAIVSKRQYKSHVGITTALQILVDESQETPKKVALETIAEDARLGKVNRVFVKALCHVIADDTEYEMLGLSDYLKYIRKQIIRLEKIEALYNKMKKEKKEKKREKIKEKITSLFEENENEENFHEILNEYKDALVKKQNLMGSLKNEVKFIRKDIIKGF